MAVAMAFIQAALLISVISAAGGARILAILAFPGKSHLMIIQPILKVLAEAGHEMVVYTPIPRGQALPNYTEVVLDNIAPIQQGGRDALEQMVNYPPWKFLDCLFLMYEDILHNFLQHKRVRELIRSNEQFDLVISESFMAQEFTLLFGHIFNAPTIVVYTLGSSSHIKASMGDVLSLASIPDTCSASTNKMAIGERVMNVFCVLRGLYLYHYEYLPRVQRLLMRYVPEAPDVRGMIDNVSLVFTNDHLTADYPQPRLATMVSVGGLHIQDVKPLPQDLKKFMEDAEHGVVLMSMGSVIPEETKPQEYFDTFVNVFKKLGQRVLWKTTKDVIGLPTNIMTVKWMPQLDVLAHPKCVLFITHGGMASLQEAIHVGVPTVAIPHLGDQHRNAEYFRAEEVGVVLHPGELSEETISEAILEMLGNSKYKENMMRLSRIFKDRPMSPARAVVYWTEYVLRHRGAPHLKPSTTRLPWYQLALLDVLGVVLAGTAVMLAIVWTFYRTIFLKLQAVKFFRNTTKNRTNLNKTGLNNKIFKKTT